MDNHGADFDLPALEVKEAFGNDDDDEDINKPHEPADKDLWCCCDCSRFVCCAACSVYCSSCSLHCCRLCFKGFLNAVWECLRMCVCK